MPAPPNTGLYAMALPACPEEQWEEAECVARDLMGRRPAAAADVGLCMGGSWVWDLGWNVKDLL